MLKIEERFLSLGKRARSGRKFEVKPNLITIHWIGPFPRQSVIVPRNWWERGNDGLGIEASAHFIVKNRDVLQALPLDEIGWHTGDRRNLRSIGVEVIPMNVMGEFALDTINTLKELVAHIRSVYSGAALDRHFDGRAGKDCPRYYTPVTSMSGGGRVENPFGGNARWCALRDTLNDVLVVP